ncbi:MAG: hypothetical protein JKY25_03900 [Robiginitomaculum sp.]|nr:hypothetical protein [Robiginitomaculum sp.]
MDGFIFFLIFIFVVLPVLKNIFGDGKSAQKNARAKANKWGQNHQQIKNDHKQTSSQSQKRTHVQDKYQYQYDKQRAQRNRNNHKQTSFQTHQRTHPRTQDQRDRDKDRDDRQRETHERLASLQNRNRSRDIIRTGNKGRDDWGVRGDNSGIGGVITVIILGVITFFTITYFAPVLMDMLNDF